MNRKRIVLASFAVFLVSQALAILTHGFILAGDYKPYYGTLLRSQVGPPPWQAVLLPVAHALVAIALVRVATLVREGTALQRGLRVAMLGWMLTSAPMFLLWYAEQPWSGSLVLKQLALEFAGMLVTGAVAARMTQTTAQPA